MVSKTWLKKRKGADTTSSRGGAQRSAALDGLPVNQRTAPEPVVPVAPPVPVVPEGPTEPEPVLPEVPPDGAPDMPAPLPDVESVVLPAVPPMVPAPPLMPEPVVELPDIVPPELLPDGAAVVPGVMVVEAPGDVVSSARRSQPATKAVNAAVANTSLASLDTDCMEISFDVRVCLLLHGPDSGVHDKRNRLPAR